MKHLIQMSICRTRSKFRRYKRIRSIRFKTSLITFKSIEAIEVAIVLTRINSKIILQEAVRPKKDQSISKSSSPN